ncbi:MAG: CRISPR-associated helicase Cas3' [Candidatus Jordarchaeales archaeon]
MAEGLLQNKYLEACNVLGEKLGWKPRPGVLKVLGRLDELLDRGEEGVVLMEYPAGYGKSTMTLTLAKAAVDGNPFFLRVIHVLPMRTIVDDLGQRLRCWMEILGYRSSFVGVQHMGSPGSPFFAKKCVVVTLDTFLLNFYKAPAYELAKLFKYDVSHYEFPRGNIYSSIVVFDEFHLLSPQSAGELSSLEDEARALCSATRAIIQMACVGVPVVVMTATMPKTLKEFLKEHVEESGLRFEEESYSPSDDKEFEERRRKKMLKLVKLDGNSLKGILEEVAECHRRGKRVMVVLNTVKAAVDAYGELKAAGLSPVLLHGRLPELLKRERSEAIKKTRVLVATQVVEAGIDESFDVLVSEVCPPDRLLQRMGRVARREGHDEGEVVVVARVSKGVYDQRVVDETWKLLGEHSDFRSRSEVEDEVRTVMDKVYSEGFADELRRYFKVFEQSLGYLDAYPFITSSDARDFIEHVGKITPSFGIVPLFAAEDVKSGVYLQNPVALSEKMAKNALKQGANLVKDGKIVVPSDRERKGFISAENLSLELLKKGYDGLVVDKIDREVGYVGVED